jgi:hypothetical protein
MINKNVAWTMMRKLRKVLKPLAFETSLNILPPGPPM